MTHFTLLTVFSLAGRYWDRELLLDTEQLLFFFCEANDCVFLVGEVVALTEDLFRKRVLLVCHDVQLFSQFSAFSRQLPQLLLQLAQCLLCQLQVLLNSWSKTRPCVLCVVCLLPVYEVWFHSLQVAKKLKENVLQSLVITTGLRGGLLMQTWRNHSLMISAMEKKEFVDLESKIKIRELLLYDCWVICEPQPTDHWLWDQVSENFLCRQVFT